jgi:hypothetical protein
MLGTTSFKSLSNIRRVSLIDSRLIGILSESTSAQVNPIPDERAVTQTASWSGMSEKV